jgi:hypothetical protein
MLEAIGRDSTDHSQLLILLERPRLSHTHTRGGLAIGPIRRLDV